MLKVNYKERLSINDIIHKSIFTIKSKEISLFFYTNKILNSKEKRYIKINNRFIINRDYDKKIKSFYKIKEKQGSKNVYEELNDIRIDVEDILGKSKAEQIFRELNSKNIDEIIYKYNYDNFNSENNEKLKILLVEYIHLLSKSLIIEKKLKYN